jgi:sulfatase maturation enzyme AslB (radical SAM superfamily)
LGKTAFKQKQVSAFTNEINLQNFVKSIPSECNLYFAGGEPLIQKEHLYILESLIGEESSFCKDLKYTTNLSTLNYKGVSFIELWDNFKSTHVQVSLDGIGDRGVVLRKGLKWKVFDNNLTELLASKHYVEMHITVSSLNINSLLEVIDYCVSKNMQYNSITFNMLSRPSEYCIQNLPIKEKNKLELLLLSSNHFNKMKSKIISLINFMNIEAKDLSQKLLNSTHLIDQLRKEGLKEDLKKDIIFR